MIEIAKVARRTFGRKPFNSAFETIVLVKNANVLLGWCSELLVHHCLLLLLVGGVTVVGDEKIYEETTKREYAE